MKSNFFVDLHCHPSIKPYARSFRINPGIQSDDPNDRSSIWKKDSPSTFDKIKNYVASLTNFIQSDGRSLLEGRVAVACLSFYPQEKSFFQNKAGDGIISDTLTTLATEFGQERIDDIQARTSYWDDLKKEMNFLRQQENKIFEIDGRTYTYEIAESFASIDLADRSGELGESKIIFVPTIEGAHVFDQMVDSFQPFNMFPGGLPEDVLQTTLHRVNELRDSRNGYIRPFFITFAHHFWNGLCGHEHSLGGFVRCIADQENGAGTGFTTAGKEVARAMLQERKDDNGLPVPPIIIDIKHMSRKSREEYFEFLAAEFPGRNVPMLASHAGVTGLSKPGGLRNTPAAQEGLFMEDLINIFDDEILAIEASAGVIGIQMDERRIGSKQALRKARGHINRREILYSWAKLVWNQVRHMAELLDLNERYAWNIQCLGTDFDGIVDPINGYWTAREIDYLDDYLLKHAFNYLTGNQVKCPLKQERNRAVSAEEVVERVMTSNALEFLSRIG